MNATIFKYSVGAAVVLVAAGVGAWYFLAPPKAEPIEVPRIEEPGVIEGTTSYPGEFVPAQKVCAQSVTDPLYERCTDAAEGAGEGAPLPAFSVKVAPGSYYVYALLKDPADMGLTESRRAYWSEFVQCGMTQACMSHANLEVVVGAGETVIDINPYDWYAM